MASFHDVQRSLDRILGGASPGNHKAFWRGRTRDEFVALRVFGLAVVQVGDPESSNLVRALRGLAPFGSDLTPPPDDAFLPRMPMDQPPAAPEEIALIEDWIRDGCPEEERSAGFSGILASIPAAAPAPPGDDDHVAYWRDVDLFFLPGLSSPETEAHVDNVHVTAFRAWRASHLTGSDPEAWTRLTQRPEILESFRYLRFHQQRLITQYYGASQDHLFDSLWKFGGDLLPPDPQSMVEPQHRMNSILDWSFWIPYIELSITQPDTSEADLGLARAWQVGIAADGLLRGRKPIPEFDPADPDLRFAVMSAYAQAPAEALLAGMRTRAAA